MKPYSSDPRGRVAAAVDHREGSLRRIARRFRISLEAASRWLQRRRRTGSLDPGPRAGGRPRAVDRRDAERLHELVRQQPDATRDELRARPGPGCSRMAISRAALRLRISRKEALHACERDTPPVQRERRLFRRRSAPVGPGQLVSVDETGAHTAMTRTYGRAPIGRRVEGAVPGHRESVTSVAGSRRAGVVSPMASTGALGTPAFEGYGEQILAPELRPGDGVIRDDLKPHRSPEARRSVRGAGARSLPPPPYSPDLTPIGEMYSKVEEILRAIGARATAAVDAAMDRALKAGHGQDILGWFRSCGLCPTQT